MRGMNIQLADTAITNHMGLTVEQLEQIAIINQHFDEAMKAKMGNRSETGKKLSKEEREARSNEIKTMRKQARKELREVLGTELYIQYLEEAADRMPMRGFGGPGMSGDMQGGQGRRMRGGFEGGSEGGFGGPGGGFGGPGGGFGGDF